ncbi:MAG: amidohydrolase [Prevotella sp.]|nr:amidohydrolase [Prevotella sp.]
MKTAIIQHFISWNEMERNLRHLTSLLEQQQGADLYVLAETFATGFLAEDSAKLAGEQWQRIFSWMQQQASRLDAAICGSVAAVDEKGQLRNRLFFVRPDGTYDYYDKRHLFGFAGETDEYVAGERRVVTEWRGVRFLLQVCYDLRFPVFSRCHGDYDAIIYVANWPAKRRDVWQTLLKARALENQCFVVGVNCVGSDKVCDYYGDSMVFNAYGWTIAICKSNMEEIAVADIDMEELQHFRHKFPVLEDADEFEIPGFPM